MTEEIQAKIKRLNDSASVFSVDIDENMNIKELEVRWDAEFAADFAKVLETVKAFKDKWATIYR